MKFDLIKKMLKGSTTMPSGTAQNNVHYHDGVACTHDHSHDHNHGHRHHDDHVHDETHAYIHQDGDCCGDKECSNKKG